jgi:hypothetical protein
MIKNACAAITAAVLIVLISGCDKKTPVNLWANRPTGDPNPVIQNIEPVGRAGAGVMEIVIHGENFGSSKDQNSVYFGNVKAEILSASSTEITVMRPSMTGDSISVRVVVQNASETAQVENYAIDPVAGPFGLFLPTDVMQSMTADKDGNIYVAMADKSIKKATPDGQATDYSSFAGVIGYSTTSDMRVGPDGRLYLQPSKSKRLFTVPPGGGDCVQLLSYFDTMMNFFDFDEYGNIYAGGSKKNINVARPDNSTAQVHGADYSKYDVTCVRVCKNKVFVYAQNATTDMTVVSGIYSHEITSSNGDLGPAQLVLDWASTGEYAASTFKDMTFSADGDLFIATTNLNPIFMVKSNGEQMPLYQGSLTSTAEELAWSGTTLFQRLGGAKKGVLWIAMGMEGAPYYGRP